MPGMWPVLLSRMPAMPQTNSAEAHRVEPRLFVLSSGRSVEVFELLEVEVEGFAAGLAECQAPNPSISGAFLNSHDSGIVGHVDHHDLRVLSVALARRWRPARQTRNMTTTAANAPMVLGVVTPPERRGNRAAMYAAMTRNPPPTTSHVPTRSDQSSRDRSGRAAHKLAWPSTLRPDSHTMISLRSEVGQDHRERSCPARRYPPSELA